MAKAKAKEPVRPSVILELTPEEAEALVRITYRVGGTPESTRRGKIDANREALESVGYNPHEYFDEAEALNGHLTFTR